MLKSYLTLLPLLQAIHLGWGCKFNHILQLIQLIQEDVLSNTLSLAIVLPKLTIERISSIGDMSIAGSLIMMCITSQLIFLDP